VKLNKNRPLALEAFLMQKRLSDALRKDVPIEFCINALRTFAVEFRAGGVTLEQYIALYCTIGKRLRKF
jgi:hypothetical protein